MNRVLITGVAGFIGCNLAKRLTSEGYTVIGIDDLNTLNDGPMKLKRLASLGVIPSIEKKITAGNSTFLFHQISINDELAMQYLFKHHTFDSVIHLAAHAGIRNSLKYPQQFLSSNVLGFEVLLRCCRDFHVNNVIFASSSSVYGNRTGSSAFKESDKTDSPMSVYAASKKADELLAHSYASLYGLAITGLRFFTVYGPWVRTDMATYLFMDSIKHNRPITLFNNGDMLRDFTYVDDVVNVVSLLLKRPHGVNKGSLELLNVGNETVVRLADFVDVLERLIGRLAEKTYQPIQAGDVPMTHANTSRLREQIGYVPATVIEDGLKETVDWYLQQ
jgi:UDP-glucuronate 4-epimerase